MVISKVTRRILRLPLALRFSAIAISRPDRLLTINENFTNEAFTELWVIPVTGELKDQFI
ncbi:MAG: hypothetical protein KME32_26020 [Mojavia pulchra JT2-VF2]|uniref:Uncharacterized protein n=1 Tax=Mojavia pulchra JT2-VF2 TaxID=287848 RepID=A0A951UIA0_9NOST|nr:hypothetical protein [Mojavia pulchra JT2-VF2]